MWELFGCRHKRLTRPITPAHKPGTKAGAAYVACLDCGRQFHYDTQNLTMGPALGTARISRPSDCHPAQTGY